MELQDEDGSTVERLPDGGYRLHYADHDVYFKHVLHAFVPSVTKEAISTAPRCATVLPTESASNIGPAAPAVPAVEWPENAAAKKGKETQLNRSTILLPLDGSELAERAVPAAAALARNFGATIQLLQAVPTRPTLSLISDPIGVDWVQAPDEAAVQAHLEWLAAPLRESGLDVTTKATAGEPGTEILTAATSQSADLIVMSTHGRSGLSRAMLGSVATHVLKSATVPVVLLRIGATPPIVKKWPRTILVALDGSAIAETVLPTINRLARLTGAEVTLLQSAAEASVTLPMSATMLEEIEQISRENRFEVGVYLSGIVDRLTQEGIRTRKIVAQGDPAAQIRHTAKVGDFDLIAMATHGRTGVARWLFGSVADQVVRTTDEPVLLIGPALWHRMLEQQVESTAATPRVTIS